MNCEVDTLEKNNEQQDYMYMAKNYDGEYKIGYLVIDKPWYSSKEQWTCYIVSNIYGSGGCCGGAVDLGFEKEIVDQKTIEPYTQIAKIKFNQSIGLATRLVKDFLGDSDDKRNLIVEIKPNDKIPYKLWRNK